MARLRYKRRKVYCWPALAMDPEPARRQAIEEAVVLEAREILRSYVLPGGELQLVDPLLPDRKVGKSYLWPNADGWEVSGFYRRDKNDRWHPYLMSLSQSLALESIKVRDSEAALVDRAENNPKLNVTP